MENVYEVWSKSKLIERCRKLGSVMPDGVDDEIVTKLLAKIICQEKIMDEDAFEIASNAYAEGYVNERKDQ